MADVYEQNLGSKSSLTTSDYIRVVGSDNVSYKQGIPSLMDAISVTRTLISNNADFDSLVPNATLGTGYYRGNNISTMTNRPSPEGNAYPWALDAINVSGYVKQILHVYTAVGNVVVYERIQYYSSGSSQFADWEKMPTRAEVDALTTKTSVSVTASTNVVIDVNNSYKLGKTLFLNVKGHTTANVANAYLLTFLGASPDPYNFTFGIPIGSGSWAIDSIAYGYINQGAVTATIQSGKYFHIAQAFICS